MLWVEWILSLPFHQGNGSNEKTESIYDSMQTMVTSSPHKQELVHHGKSHENPH